MIGAMIWLVMTEDYIMCIVLTFKSDHPIYLFFQILMDFVQNGTNGLALLLKRLRERFPNAVLVYVKLVSFVANAMEKSTGALVSMVKQPKTSVQWAWRQGDVFNRGWSRGSTGCGRDICDSTTMEQLVIDFGGIIYEMPKPNNPNVCLNQGWFAPDLNHLTKIGHEILAKDLIEFLYPLESQIRHHPKPLGTWASGGDQCYNWFLLGSNPLLYSKSTAVMKNLNTGQNTTDEKWVLQITNSATIEFDSTFDTNVPIGIGYMSRQEPTDFYPIVDISINTDKPVTVDPRLNNVKGVIKTVHVTAFSHVGSARPGHNVITIQQVSNSTNPFRIVGVYLCGACVEMGHLGRGAMNYQETAL